MTLIKIFKTKRILVNEIKEQNLHIEHLKQRLLIYEKNADDVRELRREKEELTRELIIKDNRIIKLQQNEINYLQNQREIEEINEKLEEKNEVLKDIIKGSKTITTARKEADKLKEVE